MIAGALEIIRGVDAGVVHPLLLPASQGAEKFGYIVIAYDDSPEVYDILFLRGDRVEEYACLHHDIRALLSEQSVQMGLSACGMRCRVYLFSVSRQGFDRFLRTFHAVPSLNVVIDRLSRKQLCSLVEGTGSRNGILEIDTPAFPFPLITLNRFSSADDLVKEALRYRQGRMMVYDLELNARIRQRVEVLVGMEPPDESEPADSPARPEGRPGAVREGGRVPGGGGASSPEPHEPPRALPEEENGRTELAGAFRNALLDFQNAVDQIYGERMKKRLGRIIARLFPSSEPFDPGMITAGNGTMVLNVIEECLKRSWNYSRPKLRTKSLEIVKDLYDNNHDLLEKHGVARIVQECFERLEK